MIRVAHVHLAFVSLIGMSFVAEKVEVEKFTCTIQYYSFEPLIIIGSFVGVFDNNEGREH